ncbi:hypothetical protein NUW58_g63 [Xylaria curta]|uniref:Uncharacterized protein n=1 Tax=Xylaria curta TaxID=42375 RepID=A0ACC1PSN4_9PEZI|nr:hypothetical protein NUW58_g63 [Xylaria curta]
MGNSKAKKKLGRKQLPDLPIVGNQRKWNIIKVILRIISLALSITDTAELVTIETASTTLDYWPVVAFPVLAGFILWDVIEFIVMIARGGTAKGIHPGAHVGVELILWLGSVFTIVAQAVKANWSQLGAPDYVLEERALLPWVRVALTQFSFLGLLVILRFVLFVRACVEVDRRKKDRRVQQLVFAIQKQGRNPQDIPLSAFKAVRAMDRTDPSTVIKALSNSANASMTEPTTHAAESSTKPQRSRSSAEERDFAYKYNFPIVTVPELLESGIHPEDARNQKVLIGAFPR